MFADPDGIETWRAPVFTWEQQKQNETVAWKGFQNVLDILEPHLDVFSKNCRQEISLILQGWKQSAQTKDLVIEELLSQLKELTARMMEQ